MLLLQSLAISTSQAVISLLHTHLEQIHSGWLNQLYFQKLLFQQTGFLFSWKDFFLEIRSLLTLFISQKPLVLPISKENILVLE